MEVKGDGGVRGDGGVHGDRGVRGDRLDREDGGDLFMKFCSIFILYSLSLSCIL